ncbi:MAG: hypothetical protein ACYDBS_09710, partial [Acidimicrobiales bacterium]
SSQPAGWVGSVLLLNAATSSRRDVAELDLTALDFTSLPASAIGPDGVLLPLQDLGDGIVLFPARVPGSGWARYDLVTTAGAVQLLENPASVCGHTLSNGLVSVTVDGNGLVTSLRDLEADREIVEPGQRAN